MESSDSLSMARQWLMAGQPDRALASVRRRLDEAVTLRRGERSARFELAWVLAWTDRIEEALAEFARCHASPPGPDEPDASAYVRSLRDRGLLLAEHGRLGEAADALGKAWEETGRILGRDSLEQALLAEPLGQALLSLGQTERALELLDKAVAILARQDHQRVTGALALREEARQVLGEPSFADMPELTDEGATQLFRDLAKRAEESDPVVMERVFREGIRWIEEVSPDNSELPAAYGVLAGLSGSMGDTAAQVEAINRAIEIYRARREDGFAIQALQGRALALAEAGDDTNAEADYRAALDQATRAGSLPLMSQLARNLGRFHSDRGDDDKAHGLYKDAVDWARESSHPEMTGKALVAFGMHLAHRGDRSASKGMFAEALGLLPPSDPHAAAASGHLDAMRDGKTCVCLDPLQVMARDLKKKIRGALPPRTARAIEISFEGGQFHLQLDLVRELNDSEQAALNRVLNPDG